MKNWKILAILMQLGWALIGGAESLAGANFFGQERGAVNHQKKKGKKQKQKSVAAPPIPPMAWQYARNGDFISAKLKSAKKFGYGMFVCEMQAAMGPVCSTFWLYADAPAPGCMPEIAQMWRWNEFDWEFVPYTQTTQNSYITLSESGFPGMTLAYYGSAFTPLNTWKNGQITDDKLVWVKNRKMTDDTVFADMQNFYNYWMVDRGNPKTQITQSDIGYQGASNTTGPNHKIGGLTDNPQALPGWYFAQDWKYPATKKSFPASLDVKTSATINWWRTPKGSRVSRFPCPGSINRPSNTSSMTM